MFVKEIPHIFRVITITSFSNKKFIAFVKVCIFFAIFLGFYHSGALRIREKYLSLWKTGKSNIPYIWAFFMQTFYIILILIIFRTYNLTS